MHDLKIREAVLDQIRQGKTMLNVAQSFDIPIETVRGWAKKYNIKPIAVTIPRYSLEKKIEVIQLSQQGIPVREIIKQQGISKSAINNWIRDKNRLLAVYSVQKSNPDLSVNLSRLISSEKKESDMSYIEDVNDLKGQNHNLKKELEFYRAKAAYLETLLELNGFPASSVKKKQDITPSTGSSNEESEI